ncbi:MAG: polymerase subunit alpha [Pseudomonadota bacterium]
MAKMQADRFSGGYRLSIQQVWDLPSARCRFGKFLRVSVNGRAPEVARMVKDFPPQREMTEQGELLRGLPVRLKLERRGDKVAAAAELLLGEQAKFFPSDAALSSWIRQGRNRLRSLIGVTSTLISNQLGAETNGGFLMVG